MFLQQAIWHFSTIDVTIQVLYAALSAILILFGYDLLERYLKADKRTRTDAAYIMFFIIAFALIGYGLNLIPTIVNYFYPIVDWVYAMQQFVLLVIVVPFAMVAEQFVIKKKLRISFITVLGIIISIYMMVIVIMEAANPDTIDISKIGANRGLLYPVWISYAVFGLVGFFGFLVIFFKLLSPQKEIKRKMLLGLLFGIIAMIGAVIQGKVRIGFDPHLPLGVANPNNANWWYVYGALIEIASWLMMRYMMLSIPNYGEFEWKTGMIEMHVILAETGISLYYRSLRSIKPEELKGNLKVTVQVKEDENRPNTDLVAGGLIGIKGMLGEISGDRGKLENIQIGEKNLIFKQGDVLMALLLCDKNLGVYHSILREMVTEIERTHPDLKNFNGDTRSLHIGPIVDHFFGLKVPATPKQGQ